MRPRSLRFLQTLALVSGTGALAACGARTPLSELDESSDAELHDVATVEDIAPLDVVTIDVVTIDVATADVVVRSFGTCREGRGTGGLTCGEGMVCDLSSSSPVRCVPPTAAPRPLYPCGVISCAEWCSCSDPKTSTCGCSLPTEGPLPPPDLPMLA